MMVIDYTQYRCWMECPWKWWEKYGRGLRKVWPPTTQRKDAMALGQLTHAGLEVLYREGRVEIPPRVVEEVGPTPELVGMARRLVEGYAKVFMQGEEEWVEQGLEEPLRFQVGEGGGEEMMGLAKVDRWFEIHKEIAVRSGLEGFEGWLEEGVWGMEFKTRASERGRAAYAKGWEVNMQGTFQILALREMMRGMGRDPNAVQGVLVRVIEKPDEYVPKRKCKGCGKVLEMGTYLWVEGEGLWACPLCGEKQMLTKAKEKVEKEVMGWQIPVTRGERELEQGMREIRWVADMMMRMREMCGDGRPEWSSIVPNRENCIGMWGRECEYYEPHLRGLDVREEEGYVKVESLRYMEKDEGGDEEEMS